VSLASEPDVISRNRSLLLPLAGAAALWLVLQLLGGWALPTVVFAILLIVMFHEMGHLITAKLSGMRATDFFVGFGPVLWSKKFGETRYGVRALPLGGYVKVPGMSWSEDVPAEYESRTYRASTYPRKVLFASAGSLAHLIMALVLAWASLSFIGRVDPTHVGVQALSSWGATTTPAQLAGLQPGDRILKIDGHSVTNVNVLTKDLHNSTGALLTIEIVRSGRDKYVHVRPVDGRTVVVGGQRLSPLKGPATGYIGIVVEDQSVTQSPLAAVPHAARYVWATVTAGVSALVHVFSPSSFSSLLHQVTNTSAATNPKNQLSRPESIVGVVRIAVQGASAGAQVLLAILISLNVFVGILNMLPMLPLDGGHVAIATYERLRTRKSRQPYHADINKLLPFAFLFMAVLLVLFASTLYLDIAHPIANPFQ
jgi:membrane-associated protease RseP (regulator of RpoE activity)